MKTWYVVHSNPQKELLLWEQFYLRGIESYYPRIRVQPVNPRAHKVKPYFPGYLFIRVDLNHVVTSSLRWMPGAAGLVSFGDEAATIPDELVQAIKQKVDAINDLGGEGFEGLIHGTPIIIRDGPFDGYQAIFDARLSDKGRARVLLEVLQGHQLRVELPVGQIEQLSQFQS